MADVADEFDLDAAYAEEVRPPFRFRWAGVAWELPHLGDMDWRAVSLADEMDINAIKELFQLAFPPERAEEWEKVRQPTPAMIQLFQRWLAHSGMKPGETQGSEDSSENTEPASKRTSRSTTGSGSRGRSSAARKTGSARVTSSA
ncbi:hypothetical protein [Plantactinospora sp. WMMB782]|uniref:hypothetical protein n=1 Tax=Plantactinospora sp. WMMB782 TaxID=3404121 RepID=UPI003B931CD4